MRLSVVIFKICRVNDVKYKNKFKRYFSCLMCSVVELMMVLGKHNIVEAIWYSTALQLHHLPSDDWGWCTPWRCQLCPSWWARLWRQHHCFTSSCWHQLHRICSVSYKLNCLLLIVWEFRNTVSLFLSLSRWTSWFQYYNLFAVVYVYCWVVITFWMSIKYKRLKHSLNQRLWDERFRTVRGFIHC